MITIYLLEDLASFQLDVCKMDFIVIFGTNMGEHLWEKYTTSGYNLLYLWQELSKENKLTLASYLNINLGD